MHFKRFQTCSLVCIFNAWFTVFSTIHTWQTQKIMLHTYLLTYFDSCDHKRRLLKRWQMASNAHAKSNKYCDAQMNERNASAPPRSMADGWMAPCAKQMSNFLRSLLVTIRIGMLVTWTFKKTISYYWIQNYHARLLLNVRLDDLFFVLRMMINYCPANQKPRLLES